MTDLIPTKRPRPTPIRTALDINDAKLSEKIPSSVKNTLDQYFHDSDERIEKEINDFRNAAINRNIQQKTRYLNDICVVYTDFMGALVPLWMNLPLVPHAIQPDPSKFTHRVKGQYDDRTKEPSVKYWRECNPGKYAAVSIVIEDLTAHGWSPKISGISKYSIDDAGYRTYIYGGDELIVTCDFTQ